MGIIPAYAGSTSEAPSTSQAPGDHPRIRGEHFPHVHTVSREMGSSPHTRGARRPGHPHPRRQRIIPAYAGSTLVSKSKERRSADHPRIRGEHRTAYDPASQALGSSPHTRGALAERQFARPFLRIIPPYAGSTCPRCHSRRRGQDHPRIRGEHIPEAPVFGADVGSSPHTRGAPLFARAHDGDVGIIPAYAGSTGRR